MLVFRWLTTWGAFYYWLNIAWNVILVSIYAKYNTIFNITIEVNKYFKRNTHWLRHKHLLKNLMTENSYFSIWKKKSRCLRLLQHCSSKNYKWKWNFGQWTLWHVARYILFLFSKCLQDNSSKMIKLIDFQ